MVVTRVVVSEVHIVVELTSIELFTQVLDTQLLVTPKGVLEPT